MPPIHTEHNIRVGIYEFKCNIAKYIRELNRGEKVQVILTDRGKPIGGFFTFKGIEAREKKAKLKELSGLLNSPDSPLTDLLNGSDNDQESDNPLI